MKWSKIDILLTGRAKQFKFNWPDYLAQWVVCTGTKPKLKDISNWEGE